MPIDAAVALCRVVDDGNDWRRWRHPERRLASGRGARASLGWTRVWRAVQGTGSCDHTSFDGTGDNPSSRSRMTSVCVRQSGDQRGVPPRTSAGSDQADQVGV
jgi:hypothetical protein